MTISWARELPLIGASGVVGAVLVGALSAFSYSASDAYAEQQKPAACPPGFIAVAKTPQTATIRNLGGSVEHQTANGENAIENICVKNDFQDVNKLGQKDKSNTIPNKTKPKVSLDIPKLGPDGLPCKGSLTQDTEYNLVINNSDRDIAPFSPPPGMCIVSQVVKGNITENAGIIRNVDESISNQMATENYSISHNFEAIRLSDQISVFEQSWKFLFWERNMFGGRIFFRGLGFR